MKREVPGNSLQFNPFAAHAVITLLLVLNHAATLRALTFEVTNTSSSGSGSFNQAVNDALNTPGEHVIDFQLSGGSAFTVPIGPTGQTFFNRDTANEVEIDGATQEGFSGMPVIELKGRFNYSGQGALILRNVAINGGRNEIVGDGAPCTIENCYIGTGLDGESEVGRGASLFFQNFIGVVRNGNKILNNVIVTSFDDAITLSSEDNVVQGNRIGVNKTGARVITRTRIRNFPYSGVKIFSAGNLIGGDVAGQGNVISGYPNGILIFNSFADNIRIQGNKIGTDISGTMALGNYQTGIKTSFTFAGGGDTDVDDLTIGGPGAAGNIIAGTYGPAIMLQNTRNVIIQNNRIGVDANDNILTNDGPGVYVAGGNVDGLIGGDSGLGNIIAYNSVGVAMEVRRFDFGGIRGMTIRQNSIFGNDGLGIDLKNDGVTENDEGNEDADQGPNGLQNFPIITTAENISDVSVRIRGRIITRPNRPYELEFFANIEEDPSLHGEGMVFIGLTNVVTDGNGRADFDVTLSLGGLTGVDCISSTATDEMDGDTSEFSPCARITGRPGDFDLDGVADSMDNCPCTSNTAQTDADMDMLGDACDDGPGTVFFVNNLGTGTGVGTFIQAILDANFNIGRDQIRFNIPGDPPFKIMPFGSVPLISDPVDIFAFTQPGYSGAPLIELDGTGNLSTFAPISITAGNTEIRGLSVHSFPGTQMQIIGPNGNNVIVDCYIGVDSTGQEPPGDGRTAKNPAPELSGPPPPFGTQDGLRINNSPSNIIQKNLIGLNPANGIRIDGTTSTLNVVQDNFIGFNSTGTMLLRNLQNGILIENGASFNQIGVAAPGGGNRISANLNHGILITGDNTQGNIVQGNLVQGNFIGTGASGNGATSASVFLGNGQDGVQILFSPGNQIGGAGPGAGNVISDNRIGLSIRGTSASLNLVQGNTIGPSLSGQSGLGNFADGVLLFRAPDNTIGGDEIGAGNLISLNGRNGIQLDTSETAGNLVQGNVIGADVLGADDDLIGVALTGNGQEGVSIGSAHDNLIGGPDEAQGNVIAFNGGVGIRASGGASLRNAFLSNNIFGNGSLGIDLGNNGFTDNDPGDGDSGPNNLQNFPVLAAVTSGSLIITGALSASQRTTYTLQFFANPDCAEGTSITQGQVFIGALDIASTTTLAPTPFTAIFDIEFGAEIDSSFNHFSSTATDLAGNTSEISRCVELFVVEPPPMATPAQIVDFLLGLLLEIIGTDRNNDMQTDVADVITAINTGP